MKTIFSILGYAYIYYRYYEIYNIFEGVTTVISWMPIKSTTPIYTDRDRDRDWVLCDLDEESTLVV